MIDKATTLRMAAVQQRNTVPERMVRTALHRMGYRFDSTPATYRDAPILYFEANKK